MLKRRRSLKTSEITKRRRRLLGYKIVGVLALFLVVLFGLSYLSSRQSLTIQNITVTGNASTRADVIQDVAREALQGKYFYLFSKQNFLLYPKDEIREQVLNRYARLSEAKISREGLQNLVINVTEREPEYLWCGFEKPENASSGEPCYFLDDTGLIFGQAADFSDNVYVRFYGPLVRSAQGFENGFSPENVIRTSEESESIIGKYYLNAQAFASIYEMIRGVEGFDVSVVRASWNGFSNVVLDTDFGFEVRFRLGDDPEVLLENLKAVLSSQVFQAPEGRETLEEVEYFDLRFGDKVFYK